MAEKRKSHSSSFTTINTILNTSLRFLKVLLNKRVPFKILLLSQIFNTLPRNYLAVKYSKQRFNRGKSDARILKIKEFTSFALSNKFSPSLNNTMVSKYFLTRLAFLFIHGFCQCKLLQSFLVARKYTILWLRWHYNASTEKRGRCGKSSQLLATFWSTTIKYFTFKLWLNAFNLSF